MVKYLLIILSLTGCASLRPNNTYFYREKSDQLINLKGEDCSISGIVTDKDGKRMIIYFSNCDVHDSKEFDDFEVKQWEEPKKEQK